MPRPISPEELSAEIRRIAAKIDRSSSPDRKLVSSDLKKLVARMNVGSSRLMTSGGEDPEMGDLFGEKALEAKVKAYLKSVKDLFNVEFSLREMDLDDQGAGHAVFEYSVPDDPDPKSFKLDWVPGDTYSGFLAKLNAEIFGYEGPAAESEDAGSEGLPPPPPPGDQGQGQGQDQGPPV